MYHGAFCNGRGIEQLLTAVRGWNDVKLILLGHCLDEEYMNSIKTEYADVFASNARIKQAVPLTELWKYLGAVDLSSMPAPIGCRSYYLSLPNKFFEAIQAETPLLVSDFPVMRKIIDNYHIGEYVEPGNIRALKDKIIEMRAKGREAYQEGLRRAKLDFNWEKEKETLTKAYSAVIKKGT